jgi:hypothetical protein
MLLMHLLWELLALLWVVTEVWLLLHAVNELLVQALAAAAA